MTRESRPGRSWEKYFLICVALVLVGAGFYAGFRVAQPPPPPDFEQLRQTPNPGLPSPGETPGETAGEADPYGTSGVYDPSMSDQMVDEGLVDEGQARDGGAAPAGDGPASAGGADGEASLQLVRQPPPGGSGARIALVIDDLGRSLADLETLAALGIPITYAVLPLEAKTAQVVAALRRRGEEILCHLPMEARGGNNPGPGALLRSMSPDEIRVATAKALDSVPGAVGLNNHMGSAVVTDVPSMNAMLDVLSGRGLFFLDSRTTAETVGYSLARQKGVPSAERQVFLDTQKERAFIQRQFEELMAVARSRGAAVAIAHPYPETLEILAAEVPKARRLGFEFVTVGSLLDR